MLATTMLVDTIDYVCREATGDTHEGRITDVAFLPEIAALSKSRFGCISTG